MPAWQSLRVPGGGVAWRAGFRKFPRRMGKGCSHLAIRLFGGHPADPGTAVPTPVGPADMAVSPSLERRPTDPHPRNVLPGGRGRTRIGKARPLPGRAGLCAGPGHARSAGDPGHHDRSRRPGGAIRRRHASLPGHRPQARGSRRAARRSPHSTPNANSRALCSENCRCTGRPRSSVSGRLQTTGAASASTVIGRQS